MLASAAVDIAVWDIVGKASGLPLYRLFGGHRDAVPAYVTCAYYRDGKTLGELREEIEMLAAQGHRAFKAARTSTRTWSDSRSSATSSATTQS